MTVREDFSGKMIIDTFLTIYYQTRKFHFSQEKNPIFNTNLSIISYKEHQYG